MVARRSLPAEDPFDPRTEAAWGSLLRDELRLVIKARGLNGRGVKSELVSQSDDCDHNSSAPPPPPPPPLPCPRSAVCP